MRVELSAVIAAQELLAKVNSVEFGDIQWLDNGEEAKFYPNEFNKFPSTWVDNTEFPAKFPGLRFPIATEHEGYCIVDVSDDAIYVGCDYRNMFKECPPSIFVAGAHYDFDVIMIDSYSDKYFNIRKYIWRK